MLQRHTADLTIDSIIDDAWVLGAVERRLEVIEEAHRRVRSAAPEIEEDLPDIHQWIALRNVVAHDYDELDYDIIWDSATVKVNSLIAALDAILRQPDR
jgi:uncharacterized protein with HEPN domain